MAKFHRLFLSLGLFTLISTGCTNSTIKTQQGSKPPSPKPAPPTINVASPEQTPILLQTEPISVSEILTFANMSQASYSQDLNAIKAAMGNNVKILASGELAKKQLQVLLGDGPEKNAQYIAVRGTDNRSNVLTDIAFTPHKSHRLNIKFHRGFKSATDTVFKALLKELDKTRPIYITGHSLGGAIAAILDPYLRHAGFNVKRVVTFGQPRVTNEFGASVLELDTFNFRLLRIVHQHDAVTLVPKIGYVHYGPELVITDDGSFCVWPGRKAQEIFGEGKDHAIDKYVQQLSNLNSQPSKTQIGTFWGCQSLASSR